jgi:hypothetical protein
MLGRVMMYVNPKTMVVTPLTALKQGAEERENESNHDGGRGANQLLESKNTVVLAEMETG